MHPRHRINNGGKSIILIGNPENRRVTFFQKALSRFNLAAAQVIPWIDLIQGKIDLASVCRENCLLRIESPGENPEVERALLTIGAEEPDETGEPSRITGRQLKKLDIEYGRILYPRQWFLGFRRVLNTIGRQLQSGVKVYPTHPPEDIITMFDKRLCHRRCVSQSISVPRALPSARSFETLSENMRQQRCPRVFVKLANGSSASSVIAFETNFSRMQAFTSMEIVRDHDCVQLYNALRIRRYTDPADIALIIDYVCKEGAQIEQWIPKSGWCNKRCDVRLVMVDKAPRQAVVRMSRTPMTNLHLGNERGDLAQFKSHIGEDGWRKLRALGRQTAEAFPDALMVAVDILPYSGFRQFAVAEVNAFGDLLPGAAHNDLNTYETQVESIMGSHYAN